MRVLLVHNAYKLRGGEDTVLDNEFSLLRSKGIDVDKLIFDNSQIISMKDKLITAFRAFYNPSSASLLRERIKKFKPDVIHVHNFFPLASPSIFYAAAEESVPVVMTLHNYRLVCPGALLFRNGKVCEECITKPFAFKGVVRRCYRSSLLQSFTVAGVMAFHNIIGTWKEKVDKFIALTSFQKEKFLNSSLKVPEEKFAIKPNFSEDFGDGLEARQNFFLFVGRLSHEKGIQTLIEAFKRVKMPLKVVGDGPLKDFVLKRKSENVEFLGRKNKSEVIGLMKQARALILPSLWFEGFPMVIVEAFSTGTPVISSDIGSQAEIVKNGKTGFLFRVGSSEDLAQKVSSMLKYQGRELYKNARREYLNKYTPEKNFNQLISIYQEVIDARKAAAH